LAAEIITIWPSSENSASAWNFGRVAARVDQRGRHRDDRAQLQQVGQRVGHVHAVERVVRALGAHLADQRGGGEGHRRQRERERGRAPGRLHDRLDKQHAAGRHEQEDLGDRSKDVQGFSVHLVVPRGVPVAPLT